jgi:2,3-bisphosphoglycerate-dependent phosphoglycerate mutase
MNDGVLYLVRHGRTSWNRDRFLGRTDVPLDAVGEAQAQDLVGLFAGHPLDAVYASPLARAGATASPLAAERLLPVTVCADLAELDCGRWEGLMKEGHAKLSKRDPDEPFPGGESLSDALARVGGVIHAIRAAHPDGAAIAVFGHYVVNQLALGALRGDGVHAALLEAGYRPRPGSALRVTLSGGTVASAETLA